MAQPALNKNTQQARRAELEARRAQKRNEAAQKARATLRLVEGRQPNQTDSRQEKTQQKRNEAAQKSRQRMSELASGQNTSTVDPQRLQAMSGGSSTQQQRQSTTPKMEEQSRYAQQRLESTQGYSGSGSIRARQAQLREQQSIAQTLESVTSSMSANQQNNSQEQDRDVKRLERIVDLFTGTSGPTVGAVDTGTGGASLLITAIYWVFIIAWWDIKWLLGGKLGGGFGRLITPLSWGSIISAVKLSENMEKTLNEMGKVELWIFMMMLNMVILLALFLYAVFFFVIISVMLAPLALIFG